jgi:hypothetical protein
VRSMILRLIAAFCLIAVWCVPESAQAEGQWIAAPEMNALLFDGPIGPSAAEDFREILETHPESRLVAFNSPGGLVVPALEIAELIFERDINTVIMQDNICLSACAFMFMAGSTRYAVGQLGVHQISGTDDSSITQLVVAQIYDSLLTFGTDPKFLNIMFQTASEDMYIFSPAELDELSINRASRTPVRPALEPSSTLVEFDTIARSPSGSWEAVLLRNRTNGHYLCALESNEEAPLFRVVNYLTKRDAFVEIMNIPLPMQIGSERLHMIFLSQNKEPLDLSGAVNIEDSQTAWFDIDSEEAGLMIIAPLALYRHMKLETEDGRLLGIYDLSGSLRAAQAFSRCILNQM